MDEFIHTINNLNSDVEDIKVNYNKLITNLNKNNKLVEQLSHLMDIKEIIWLLNDKILKLNDSIENENLDISQDALERLKNNEIVKHVLQPYLPYILVNLCYYNT
jgi:hypothetical protein